MGETRNATSLRQWLQRLERGDLGLLVCGADEVDNGSTGPGNGGVEVFAETVTEGDPSYAGPLAGVALKIPVYHVLETEVMQEVPEQLREEKLQLSSLVIDIEPMHQVLEASRAKLEAR